MFPYLADQIKLFEHWEFRYRTVSDLDQAQPARQPSVSICTVKRLIEGAQMTDVSEILGHNSVAVTAKIYAHG